jgi:Nucleotidyltransferase of unknown function (DUF6036)
MRHRHAFLPQDCACRQGGISYTDTMWPVETIEAFDLFLRDRGLRFDGVVIGGAALSLLGIVSRPTKDVDILVPIIPQEIHVAARAFAAEIRATGEILHDDWLNNGTVSLTDHLSMDWQERLEDVFNGSALHLRCLGRHDLLCAKLFALCDRGIDLGDCIALAPTSDELQSVLTWLQLQDANPDWPEHVRNTIADVAKRISHGI